MLRYAITDRKMFHGDERQRRNALIEQARRLARNGIDFLQLRDKDLPEEERIGLAAAMRQAIADAGGTTKLLFSGQSALARDDVDGVHVTSTVLYSASLREEIRIQGKHLIVSASCHSLKEVTLARGIADLILFGPAYEKRIAGELVTPGTGLELLREACLAAAPIPVLALGGVTEANAPECLHMGAAGFASIRAFI